MTERTWLAWTEPDLLLRYSGGQSISARKRRHFACACCRRIWQLLSDNVSRHVVEITERFTDGLATVEELERAAEAAINYAHLAGPYGSLAVRTNASNYAAWVAASLIRSKNFPEHPAWAEGVARAVRELSPYGHDAEKAIQCTVLRDIYRNPFRHVKLDPRILVWNDSTIGRIAQGIYEDRCFSDLPILADALEEAGCCDAEIVSHCRQPREHVRGCWVLDLLMGKE